MFVKTFTDKYLNNIDVLKNAIIGFEFEFYSEHSYYILLDILNHDLDPIKVSGYRKYHSSFQPTAKHWKIEPDLSGGFDMIELVTGPMAYPDAKVLLLKVLKMLQRHKFKTTEKCSLHINISFDKAKTSSTLEDINLVKLILNIDEDLVYTFFPDRENNFYSKSIKKLIPFKDFNFSNIATDLLINNLELPDTKYYGVNLRNSYKGRLEYRYIGGDDYQFKTAEILQLMDYFIMLTWNSINEKMDEEDITKLNDYLSDNINLFKNFNKYEYFIAEFPSIILQVDKKSDNIIVRAYYDKIYNKLFDLITNIKNLNNCIINLDTDNNKLEIIDASFKTIFDIRNITFVECIIDSGDYYNCTFVNCDIKNAHVHNSKIYDSNVYNSKIENTYINDGCIVKDSYVYNCMFDGKMEGGVFRSGKLGDNAELDKEVKVVTDVQNYFNTQGEVDFKDKFKEIGKFKNEDQFDKAKYLQGYGTKPQI